MTLEDCTKLLAPVAIALGVRLDVPTFKAYHKALQDVPVNLLAAAVDAAQRLPRQPYAPTFPTAPMLRAMAESCRQALLAAHPYEAGECCNFTGWSEIRDEAHPHGLATRCGCYHAYQHRLADLGIKTALVAPVKRLEAGEGFDPFDARMAQVGSD